MHPPSTRAATPPTIHLSPSRQSSSGSNEADAASVGNHAKKKRELFSARSSRSGGSNKSSKSDYSRDHSFRVSNSRRWQIGIHFIPLLFLVKLSLCAEAICLPHFQGFFRPLNWIRCITEIPVSIVFCSLGWLMRLTVPKLSILLYPPFLSFCSNWNPQAPAGKVTALTRARRTLAPWVQPRRRPR